MKTKLFTDSDLDGIGCGIVMSNAGEVDITYSNPRKINNDIIAFINDGTYSEYGMIFITDLSVTIETADLIENVFDKGPVWRLLDHHLTGVHLRPYLWSIIKTHDDNGELCCGTYLIHEVMRPLLKNPVEMDKFVSLVNSYDTFNWVKEDRIEAKHFNDLFGIYGRDRFISHITKVIAEGSSEFIGPTERIVIDIEQERIERHIHNKTKQLRRFKTANYTVGVIFNEKYVSETGKTICENEPDLDFIILLDYGYRTAGMRTIRDDIDLSEIAKRFGGGGHKKAAGFPIEFYYNLLDSLWEKM
jgi:oligoribonuclease NrnB/cAMP/cGMP phosphodiesterase (DHH superfamily)